MENKEYQITYLMGAGASRNALPIVEEIPDVLEHFLNDMKKKEFRLPQQHSFIIQDIVTKEKRRVSKGEIQKEFFETINWIRHEAKNHASIDTFAKKLYVTGKITEFIKLKAILSCFFIYQQIKNPVDQRYDSFIANLINVETRALPKNIKVFSWNYDFQFEKACSAYSLSDNLGDNQEFLNVYPSSSRKDIETIRNDFAIFKLNGTTAIKKAYFHIFENIISNVKGDIDNKFINNLIEKFTFLVKDSQQTKTLLTFAWEDEDISNEVINNAIDSTKETTVLVVIGYSFPFFNRGIDRKLISKMEMLSKVYFQVPKEDATRHIQRFRSIREDIKPEPITEVDQFFIPPEL